MSPNKTRKRLKTDRHTAADRSHTMRASVAPAPMDPADFAELLAIVTAVALATRRMAERFAARAATQNEVRRARAIALSLGAAAELAATFERGSDGKK